MDNNNVTTIDIDDPALLKMKERPSGTGKNTVRKKKNKPVSGITQNLLIITIVVMGLLCICAAFLTYQFTLSSLLKEKGNELSTAAALTSLSIDDSIPGDYELVGEEAYRLFKGDTDITEDYSLVDEISDLTGLEVSLIYRDTRILTTITEDGKRVIGTGLADKVTNALESGESGLFYKNTLIGRTQYFSYYYPIVNSAGTYEGAIEICSPYSSVTKLAWKNVVAAVLVIAVAAVVLIILITGYSSGMSKSVSKLLAFTEDATSGNDAALLDTSILRRKDEFGTIAASVLEMHRSLRDSMDKDPLTKLYNRRCANRKLDIIRSHYEASGTPYCVSIGDIDFFKKVNDTYGHDAGDAVLVAVSNVLKKNMKDKGFVARWGGEEFLLVFDKTVLEKSVTYLETILDEIRGMVVTNNGKDIKITMSFGVACDPSLSKDDIINKADKHLYYSKENGRNRITSVLPEES